MPAYTAIILALFVTSTFLSLLVIPVVFSLVDDAMQLAGRLRRRGAAADHAAPADSGKVASMRVP